MTGQGERKGSDRGGPAAFDPETGEVSGSGSGAGGGNAGEDFDSDPAAGSGHPLPESEESRRGEVPESLERAKGDGEEGKEASHDPVAVNPDGEPYPT